MTGPRLMADFSRAQPQPLHLCSPPLDGDKDDNRGRRSSRVAGGDLPKGCGHPLVRSPWVTCYQSANIASICPLMQRRGLD